MEVLNAGVQRLFFSTGKTFQQLESLISSSLRWFNTDTAGSMIERGAPWEEVEQTVAGIAGAFGLLIFDKAPHGKLTSLSGDAKLCSLYMLGNPVLANKLMRADVRACLYIPLRVCIFAPDDGPTAVFSYETMSSLVEGLRNPALTSVACEIDEKLEAFAEFLTK